MTIDSSSSLIIFPKKDAFVKQGHVDRLRLLFSTASNAGNNLQPSKVIDPLEKKVSFNGLQEGTVKNIAGIWRGNNNTESLEPCSLIISSNMNKKILTSLKNKKNEQAKKAGTKRRRERSRRKNKSKRTDGIQKKYRTDLIENKENFVIEKSDSSDSSSSELEELTLPTIKTFFTKSELDEIQKAAEQTGVFIDLYKTHFWPPRAKGVFRVAPSVATLQSVTKEIKSTSTDKLFAVLNKKVLKKKFFNEHLLAAIIKKTLRDLQTPAIPTAFYETLLSVSSLPGKKQFEVLEKIIQELPPIHFKLIGSLMLFLNELSCYQETTSMDPNNLSIVIAPNILSPPTERSLIQLLEDTKTCSHITELMITNAKRLF